MVGEYGLFLWEIKMIRFTGETLEIKGISLVLVLHLFWHPYYSFYLSYTTEKFMIMYCRNKYILVHIRWVIH